MLYLGLVTVLISSGIEKIQDSIFYIACFLRHISLHYVITSDIAQHFSSHRSPSYMAGAVVSFVNSGLDSEARIIMRG